MEEDLNLKVERAVRLIRSVGHSGNVFIAYSGGKDSVVIHWLAKEAGIKAPLLHNVTTIDPPYTIRFCEKNGAQLVRPLRTFLELVEDKGMPTMFRRFCCKELKEKFIGAKGIFGIRRSESVRRAQCYDDISDIYYYSKRLFTERWFPILNFTDEDIETIVNEKGLECHPLYYDENGKFDVSRRLGCIGCPLQGDRGCAEYKQYPQLLRLVIKRLEKFHIRQGRTIYDAHLNAVYNLFYSNHGFEKFQQAFGGLFETDPKEMLENYFDIRL